MSSLVSCHSMWKAYNSLINFLYRICLYVPRVRSQNWRMHTMITCVPLSKHTTTHVKNTLSNSSRCLICSHLNTLSLNATSSAYPLHISILYGVVKLTWTKLSIAALLLFCYVIAVLNFIILMHHPFLSVCWYKDRENVAC